MKNLDFRSVIIGILSSALIFTLLGMHLQDENLGDITVRSIKIRPGDHIAPFVLFNKDNQLRMAVILEENGEASLTMYSKHGRLATLSSSEGDASIQLYNKHDKEVVNIQSNKDADGAIYLKDRYGDTGWSESGKK